MKLLNRLVIWLNFGVLSLLSFAWYYLMDHEYRKVTAFELDMDRLSNEWSCVLYRAGGRVLPPIKYNYEYNRFVISGLLHRDINHLLGNAFFHFAFLESVAHSYSMWDILFVTYYSLLGGNIVSSVYMPNQISVGNSGIVFSLIGLLTVERLYHFKEAKHRLRSILELALILSLVVLSINPYIDIFNHGYGFVTGLIAGFIKESYSYRSVLIAKLALLGTPLLHGAYIAAIYGSHADHASAILDMGC